MAQLTFYNLKNTRRVSIGFFLCASYETVSARALTAFHVKKNTAAEFIDRCLPVCCQEKHKAWAAMSDFSFVTQGPCKSLRTAVFATRLARKLGHGTSWSGSQDPSTQRSSSRALSKDIGASSSFAWMSIYAKFAKTGYSLYVPWKDEMSSHVSQCFQGVWYFKTRTDLGCHNLSSGWLITFLKFYCIL